MLLRKKKVFQRIDVTIFLIQFKIPIAYGLLVQLHVFVACMFSDHKLRHRHTFQHQLSGCELLFLVDCHLYKLEQGVFAFRTYCF